MSCIRFGLNARMTQEDLLIQRIRSLPKDRRQEYLRNLLIKGFRQECLEAAPRRGADESQSPRERPNPKDAVREPLAQTDIEGSDATEPVEITLTSLKNIVG